MGYTRLEISRSVSGLSFRETCTGKPLAHDKNTFFMLKIIENGTVQSDANEAPFRSESAQFFGNEREKAKEYFLCNELVLRRKF